MEVHRKSNFNSLELEVMLAGIYERRDKLFGHLSASLTHRQKEEYWNEIAQLVNSCSTMSGTVRTTEKLRTKWSNIKCAGLRELSERHARLQQTGELIAGSQQKKTLK